MANTKTKKLNMELLTDLSSKDYRRIANLDFSDQIQSSYYMNNILSNAKGYKSWDDKTWKDSDDKDWPYMGKLYHANSATTSIDYVRTGCIYSREKGDKLKKQTAQRSDDLDRSLGIYNDIFFDNSDIPYQVGTNTSAYGPVMFVFKPEVIRGERVRVTRVNPFVRDNLTYGSLFYREVADMVKDIRKEGITSFLLDPMHHTTVYNTEALPLKGNLEAIYIEKHRSGDGREKKLRDRLRRELDRNGLEEVEIAIRNAAPSEHFTGYANDYDVLWDVPEL